MRKKAKYRVGQIVLLKMDAFEAFRISKVYPKGSMSALHNYYLFDGRGKNGLVEFMLRPLTAREIGPRTRRKP